MSTQKSTSPLATLQRKHRVPFDSTALLVYLMLVHLWGLWLHPLGRDYAALAAPKASLPPASAWLFMLEQRLFGAHAAPYHAVNLAMLYACMLLVYALTPRLLKAPRWFATLTATLFMANPVHTEAVLNLCGGAADVLPALLGLGAVLAYMLYIERPCALRAVALVAAFSAAVFACPQTAPLALVFVLHALLLEDAAGRRWGMLAVCALIAAAGGCTYAALLRQSMTHPMPLLMSLYLVAYPIGLLPQTADRLLSHPSLFWFGAVVCAAILAAVYRKARQRAMAFGIGAMLLASLCSFRRDVDPYHMVGGGQLLLAAFFLTLAANAVFARMNAHPKWHKPVVTTTTLLCILLFGIKVSAISYWRDSSDYVRNFQDKAQSRESIAGILPDYRYYHGAPMCLSESIAHDTPFSRAVPHVALLPLHYSSPPKVSVRVEQTGPAEAVVIVTGKTAPLDVAPFPYDLAKPGREVDTPGGRAALVGRNKEAGSFTFRVTAQGGLPETLLPGE